MLLDESALVLEGRASRWRRFIHFWVLVWISFNRNRCPVRASALAYATLLALIPMLAVVMSITSSMLKNQGEERINAFIGKMVASLTPPASLDSGEGSERSSHSRTNEATADQTNIAGSVTNASGHTVPSVYEDKQVMDARKAAAQHINRFIQNTQSRALGVTGSVVLIFVAISMLSRIETTFNDIWGVARGRSWFMRIVLYWWVLTLVPILLVLALGLASGPQFQASQKFVSSLPLVGTFLVSFGFQLLPIFVLCITFAAFYMLMPNTKVHWAAALVGGFVGAVMFHANNLVSVLYVSRVVSNSKIYGSLGLVPVFMIGLYLSWLILLFGAQVAYAYQNRAIYVEEKQVENINQRGREFIALRLMTLIGQNYIRGEPPTKVVELAEQLGVPTRLIQQIMQTLAGARIAVETAGGEPAYLPARPMERITCYDILEAMRAPQGQELGTHQEATRQQVYGEFERIQQAERTAAEGVTILTLVNRAQGKAQIEDHGVKSLE